MKVVIMGGGKVGYYLASTLLEHGHEPVVSELERTACQHVADGLGIKTVWGDGSSVDVLEAAGCAGAGAFVSVTGADQANLVACQLAKKVFGVTKTVSRVNNPKNLTVMEQLGVDIAISSTDTLARIIEREVDLSAIRQLLALNRGTAAINEMVLPAASPVNGRTISQIKLPDECVIVSITRNGDLIIPRGGTELRAGDILLILAQNDQVHRVGEVLGLAVGE